MKKITRQLLVALTASAFVLASCGEDEDPLANGPVVSVSATLDGATLTSGSQVNVDSAITFSVSVTAPAGFNTLYVLNENDNDILDPINSNTTGLTETETSASIDFLLGYSNAGTAYINFVAVDDANQISDTVSYTFEILQPVESYEAILLGAQGNAAEGFYDAQSNTRYAYAAARDASTVTESPIDFAYYWGQTNESSLAAIDDSGLNAVYAASVGAIEGIFGTRNATRFLSSTLSAGDFDAISNNSELSAAADFEVAGSSSVTQLVVDQVIAFQFDMARGGAFGLIKVSSIDDTNGNGTITIEVKVPGSD